jgi:hypothetical protein
MQFYTWNSGQVSALTLCHNASAVFYGTVSAPKFLASTNIGINDTNPSAKLQINCANTWGDQVNESINIINSGANGNIYAQHNMGAITWYSSTVKTAAITAWRNLPASGDYVDLAFATATAGTQVERMRIMSGGSVGIGTTTPNAASPLHIKMCSNSNGDGIRIQATCSGASGSQPGIAFANVSDAKRYSISLDNTGDILQITNAAGANALQINQSNVACFAGTVCALSLTTTNGGIVQVCGNNVKTQTFFAIKSIPEATTSAFFRITTSGASSTHVQLVSSNAAVGWYASQIYHAGNSSYWGGYIGSGASISLAGGSSGYISGIYSDNAGAQNYCVTTSSNGTSTSNLVIAYITVTAAASYTIQFTQL